MDKTVMQYRTILQVLWFLSQTSHHPSSTMVIANVHCGKRTTIVFGYLLDDEAIMVMSQGDRRLQCFTFPSNSAAGAG